MTLDTWHAAIQRVLGGYASVAKFGEVTNRRDMRPLESSSAPVASLVSVVGVEVLPTRKSSEGKRVSEASSTADGMVNSADVCDAQI